MSSPTLHRHRPSSHGAARTLPSEVGTPSRGPAISLANGHPRPATSSPARFRYDPISAAWWWSPELYRLYGLAPGDVEPCLEQLVQPQHPDDRPRTLAAFQRACDSGQPICLEVRLCLADGSQRTLVLLGEPDLDDGHQVTAVSGLVADVTDGRPADAGSEAQALRTEVAQLRTAMASRATIEQAKGILMLLTGCADQPAFELLAHISSHTHRKVREVAQAITESASGRGKLPDDIRGILRDACPPGKPMH